MAYKVKTIKLGPSLASLRSLNTSRNCFLGISIDAPFIDSKHVEIVLTWIKSHFEQCLIIIGDEVHKYNELIFNGTNLEIAENKCEILGKIAERKILDNFKNLGKDKFIIKHWKEYSSLPATRDYKNLYYQEIEKNHDFKSSIYTCANKYLKKKLEIGINPIISDKEAFNLSIDYIVEEMAVFSVLMDETYLTFVYPGTILQIFKDIVLEKFVDLETILKSGTYIDLKIKKN